MKVTTGESRQRISSGSIEHAGVAALFCVFTGAISIGINVAFHIPLHMPGHQGLTQMALLVIAAVVTRRPWAATLSGLSSAALALPAFGLDPLAPSLYLLSGVVIDVLVFAGRGLANASSNRFSYYVGLYLAF